MTTKTLYLNVPFFLVRAAIYFAIWLAIVYLLNRFSRQHDAEDRPRPYRRFRMLSGPALGLYGLTVTFASIDWAMSIEPFWYSTIYGALFASGQVLSAFAFAIAVLVLLTSYPPLQGVIGPAHLRDLGSLLLAFVMVWSYLAFSQFLLIWAGNLPEEIPWYQKRLHGGWQVLGLILILVQFALPFLLLLSRDVKQNRQRLVAVAGIVLAMRFVDLFWMIMPAFFPYKGFRLHWMDAAALVGIGGLWLAWFLWELRRRPLLPVNDPALVEALHHE